MGKRRVTSILKRSGPAGKKPKNTRKASTAGPVHVAQPEKRQKQPDQEPEHRLWHAASVVDRQAAHAVAALLRADKTGIGGASIKSLTLGPAVAAKKATYAVTCETLRLLPVIRQAVEAAGLLPAHPLLPAATAYVLCYEALFGEGLRRKGPAERAVMAVLPALQARVVELQEAAGVTSARQLVAGAADERAALQGRPRAARVNTLKLSVAEALSWLRCPRNAAHTHKEVMVDALLPDVLLFPPGTDLHDHPLVKDSRLILQSKASCMPAHALAPKAGATVLDACAAPGNKTTHLAALMGGKGRVLAFDKDPKRLARLQANCRAAGAGACIAARCADFLSLPLADSAEFSGVTHALLDPSCSGSGTALSRMDHLLPSFAAGRDAAKAEADGTPGSTGPGSQSCSRQIGEATGMTCAESGNACSSGNAEEQGRNGREKGRSGEKVPDQERMERLAAFQEAALRHALTLPNLTRLVYSTCSVHARENEAVVAAVLPEAQERGFALGDPFPGWHRRGLPGSVEGAEKLVRVDPMGDGTDGFFLAVFQRETMSD